MNEKQIKEMKICFKDCGYIPNTKIKLKGKQETTLILILADELNVYIPPRLRGWIKNNLKGVWGNQKIKCNGVSDKIFDILNLMMEKLK